jgi:filamentous hemagglutinin
MLQRFNHLVSGLLIGLLTLQPVLLHAQDIVVLGPDAGPRPHVDQSANGTAVLNIATPNGAGVSHNLYTSFSAGDLILNNSATNVSTQMGGWIEGNPNLTPDALARLWIGEVLGGSQTQLNGILEVAGQSMDVVLANEFGITCNGCGFVNTGRATLTTGKPVFGADGSLSGFDVRQGLVTVGAAGLNPESRLSLADTSRVDVIARAAIIYGAMRGSSLNLVTGANLVDYDWSYDPQTGAVTGVTEQAGAGAAPALAVDVAALGGMYANAITLVATEDGVGVRLSGELASSTDIALRSDGKLTLGAPAGAQVPQIRAKDRVIIRNRGPLLLEGAIISETGNLIDIRTTDGALVFTGKASGGVITLESAGILTIAGAVEAADAFRAISHGAALTLDATAEVAADSIDLAAATDMTLAGKASANGAVDASAGGQLVAANTLALSGATIELAGKGITTAGTISADTLLRIVAGTDGVANRGTVSGTTIEVSSGGDIANSGILAGGQMLVLKAPGTVTNAATLISGNDLTIHADQILNNGGVIWANNSITFAANAALDPASLVQNTGGRIEAFQGDLVIRADEVLNLGTAPTIGASEIIKWLEQGTADPFDPVTELSSLINPAYLDADGAILPAYAAAYAELWSGVINGGTNLSSAAQGLLRPEVLTPSGTALKSELAGRWGALTGKANEVGTPDPAAHTTSLVNPAYLDGSGRILPAHADAYAALWVALASGQTTVTDEVKAILDPAMLEIESQTTDPVTGVTTTVYSNQLKLEATDVWTAMLSGSRAAYDIVKILYQDRFNDDGQLAELIAGGTVDIKADTVSNIFGNVSAGEDILITAANVTNKAMGASQLLLEVHKKPGCFTCHEGEVDFYDTFGGRIEAVGNVSISGNLTNLTLNSSEMSLQDVMDEMNAYIAAQEATGDPDLTGVPAVSSKNFHLSDHRSDDYAAPVEGNGSDIRTVIPVDTGNQTPIEVAPAVTPTLSPTTSLDALLAAGLNTIAETNPEFTAYANFITSDYMMDVDRLEYRDELVLNTSETILAALSKADVIADPGDLSWLDQPLSVPAPDGSGLRTIFPPTANLELNGKGALISGKNVTVSSGTIDNSGALLASNNLTVTADTITGTGGSFIADTGEVALTALGRIALSDTVIDARSVDIVAGQDFVGKGVMISAEADASIFAITGVTLTALERAYTLNRPGSTLTVTDQKLSSLTVGADLSIVTAADLVLAGLQGDAGGDTLLSAGGNLLMTAVQSESEFHSGNARNGTDVYSLTSHVTDLTTGVDFTATSGGQATLIGTQIDAGGSVDLAAAEGVVLAAAQDIYDFETRTYKKRLLSKKTTSHSITEVTNQGVSIAAAGDVDIIAEDGDLIAAGTSFVSNNGDINLTAVEGDIYAGAYTDIFQEEIRKSKSALFGLIRSSSTSNAIDQFNTGTDALAALDLSLVSGADTTLAGATLASGGNLNITTGGDFSVEAAIDSQRSEFFSQNMGLVTMTTITEKSFVETAVFTRLLAGQALNLDIGGTGSLTLYEQAGVDAPAPTDLYPDEILALAGLQLLNRDLANEYFYDKQTQLSPAFKALLTIVVTQGMGLSGAFNLAGNLGSVAGIPLTATVGGDLVLTWAGTAVNAFGTNFLVNSVDGLVSGNFDLGAILEGAVFSGISAGLTAGIGLEQLGITADTHPELFNGLLGTFGNRSLTVAGLLNGAIDGIITSGLSSAVYGTDFGQGFSAALLNTLVTLTLADVQFEIGELGLVEGSFQHALLHGLAGCAAAQALGADCAAGAAGGIAGSIYSGALDGTALSDEQQRQRVELIGATVGWVFSDGEADNVSAAASTAVSSLANNRQLHRAEIEWLKENAAAFAEEEGISYEEALRRLTRQAASQVDALYAGEGGDAAAAQFILANKPSGYIPGTAGNAGYDDRNQEWFHADPDSGQYKNPLINIETVFTATALYQILDGFNAANGGADLGDPAVFLTTQMMAQANEANLSPAARVSLIRTVDEVHFARLATLPEELVELYATNIGQMLEASYRGLILTLSDDQWNQLSADDQAYLANRLAASIVSTATTLPGGEAGSVRPEFDIPSIQSQALRNNVLARLATKGGAASFDDLAKFREELGLPPAGSAADKSTLAVIEVNGQKIYGINAHGQPVSGVNAISSTHAEIDALNQIKQQGIDVSGQNLTLYVDRTPCAACGTNGGIRSVVEQLNLNQLTVIGPDGPMIITPR